LKTAVDKHYNPKKYFVSEAVEAKPTFQQLLDEFLLKHKLSEVRKKNFRVICRAIMRYELFVPVTVRVPLNDKAKAVLEKYKDCEGNKLLPFISEQKYNDSIKRAFKLAEIDRVVTILDPLTNEEVKKPLYEVASSHMARRTFIGNIYKKVKDPNLVGTLSGHKEGSKAFNRYREIDEDMKKELVSMLD
jgi:integrase